MPEWGKARAGWGDSVRIDDLFDTIDVMKMRRYEGWRPIGPMTSLGVVWFEIKSSRPGKKTSRFPKYLLSWDPEKEECDPKKPDPYRDLAEKYGLRIQPFYVGQGISRKLQEQVPRKLPRPTREERRSGFKQKGTATWTPVRVAPLNNTPVNLIQQLIPDMNVRKLSDGSRKAFPPNHPKYGFDVNLKYNPDAQGQARYSVQMGDKVALTEEERGYMLWDLSIVQTLVEKLGAAKAEAKRIEAKLYVKKDDEETDGEGPEDLEDDDDDASSRRKKTAGKKVAGKRRPSDDDDDDDAPFDLDDDDDDDASSRRKKSTGKKTAGKRRPADDDDEDEDIDLDDDEDDEDASPRRKKAAAANKKRRTSGGTKRRPPDDDDDIDLDDDEDEAPATKRGKSQRQTSSVRNKNAVGKKKTAKKRRPADDDDDDDLSDFDD